MMMKMQKDANQRQALFALKLLRMKRTPQPQPVPRQDGGLLSNLLSGLV